MRNIEKDKKKEDQAYIAYIEYCISYACLYKIFLCINDPFSPQIFQLIPTGNHIQNLIHHPLDNFPLIPLPYSSFISFTPCRQISRLFQYLIISYRECLKVVAIYTFRPEKIKQGKLSYPQICPPFFAFHLTCNLRPIYTHSCLIHVHRSFRINIC